MHSRYLMIDIGAGTMDILWFDLASGQHFKAVARSPVPLIAEQIADIPGKLVVTGGEMGGGPVTEVLKQRALHDEVVLSAAAARTLHHDPAKLAAWRIKVLPDDEAEEMSRNPAFHHVILGDLCTARLQQIIEALGVPFAFEVVGLCAQDHGMPPAGVSHLDYRHNRFKERLDEHPYPHALLYHKEEIPTTFNRLLSLARSAEALPTREIYVMDSGMAAILGASMDVQIRGRERVMVLDVATSHTVGAALDRGELAGFFEYHTRDITLERIEDLVVELAVGRLEHERILAEGGHGAYLRKAIGVASMDLILATGPKRRMLENSSLPLVMGSPLGDNMMTGTVGLLEAIRRRKHLPPLVYL